MRIDVWSDIACPWCFIGKRRFERGLADFEHAADVEVHWHSYQLDPTLPERYDGSETDYLVKAKGMPREQVLAMMEHITEQAAGEGLAFDFDSLVVANSRRAHRLLHHAAEADASVVTAVKEALLSAHFEKGLDVGDPEVLVSIGTDHGLDAERVRAALEDSTVDARVADDIAQARQLGISGVPFFVLDGRLGVSGAQPSSVFTSALQQAWDSKPRLTTIGDDSAQACGPDGCAV